MTNPRISLCIIARGNEPGLSAAIGSVNGRGDGDTDVDEIILGLNGTQEERDACAVWVDELTTEVSIITFDWEDDFAAARNKTFEAATGDWLFWIDSDDVVRNAEKLRYLVAEGERRGIGCYHLPYEYRHDDKGNVTVVHNRERLMKASLGWSWKDRVHETAIAQREHVVATADDVVIVHTENKANTDRNVRLLKMILDEDPNHTRALGSMGDSFVSQGKFREAIPYLQRFYQNAELSVLQWGAATELARCYQGLQRYDDSTQWASTASLIHPEYALPYLLMAHAAWFGKRDATRALRFLNDADSRDMAPMTWQRLPQDYTTRRWDVEHRCWAALGEWGKALEVVKMSMQAEGGFILDNFERTGIPFGTNQYYAWFYLERVNCEKSIDGAEALVDHLFRRGDTLRARRFLENDLPLSVRDDPRIVRLYQRVAKLTAHVAENDDEKYQAFYEENHHNIDAVTFGEGMLNGIDYEPYRMDTVLRRLQSIGARRVLDVGCGAGEPAMFLVDHGIEVVGLDINPIAVEAANKRAKKRFKGGGKNAKKRPEFYVGSLDTKGPEDLGYFDAVIIMEVIEHLPPSKVPLYFSSAEDFLMPGGSVIITCPGMAVGDIPGIWQEFPRDHVQEFSRADLERLILASGSRRRKMPLNVYKIYDPKVSVPGFASWFLEYSWAPEGAVMPPEWDQPVVIYCGAGLEEWTAESPEKDGLGGSETWAIKTAEDLRRRGHPVIVYGAVNDVREGVIYRHASLFNPAAPFAGAPAWLTLVSRYLEVLDTPINSEKVAFIAHDVDYGAALTLERLARVDTYCVLSEWQREHTLGVYAEDQDLYDGLILKLAIIANGIEPSYFEGEVQERAQHSFIWSSSPDRGLHVLLQWWPEIRRIWPDATLDIFYGWENTIAMMPGRPWLAAFKDQVEQLAMQDGVTWHGRIGQRALAKEMQRHQFWLYPSINAFDEPWHETYCITALEAQAGGCIPLMPTSGALPERLYFGSMFDGEIMEQAQALEAMQVWDAFLLSGEIIEKARPEVLTNTWAAATDKLLAAVSVAEDLVATGEALAV